MLTYKNLPLHARYAYKLGAQHAYFKVFCYAIIVAAVLHIGTVVYLRATHKKLIVQIVAR